MAVPNLEPEAQESDLERLALAQSYYNMTESAAWKDLQEKLDGLVASAQQDMFSSREVEALKIMEEKLRWQQRALFQAAIQQIVDTQLKVRQDILDELKEQENEYTADIAE